MYLLSTQGEHGAPPAPGFTVSPPETCAESKRRRSQRQEPGESLWSASKQPFPWTITHDSHQHL